jgi:predicted Zn-dependent protease
MITARLPWRETVWKRCGRAVMWLLAGLVSVCAAGYWYVAGSAVVPLPADVRPAEIEQALRDFRFLYRREARQTELLYQLAENALRSNRLTLALDCLAQIRTEDPDTGVAARRLETQVCLKANRAVRLESAAIDLLRSARSGAPVRPADLQLVEEMLVYVYSLEYRFEARQRLLKEMRTRRPLDALLAKQLHFPSLIASKTVQQNQRLRQFLEQDPDAPQLAAAHARYLLSAGKPRDAVRLIDRILAAHPADPGVLAVALECRFEQQSLDEFRTLFGAAPDFDPNEPWLLTHIRAEGAIRAGDRALAQRYFEHLTTADPSNPLYLQGLAGVLATDTDEGVAERSRLLQRALLLAELRLTLAESDRDASALLAVADAARKLGLSDAVQDFERLASAAAADRTAQPRSVP